MGGKGGGDQTIGYKHYVGMHIVACHGPIDLFSRITVDNRTAWQGAATGGSIMISAPELFGGEGREGGVQGEVDILMGEASQTKNAYLLSKIGPAIPAYRGVASLVFRNRETLLSGTTFWGVVATVMGQGQGSGFYWGNNPYLKPVRMRGQRVYVREDGIEQWYPQRAGITLDLTGSAAFYFLLDRSASLSGSEFNAIKNAVKEGLDLIADYLTDNDKRIDIGVRFYSTGSSGMELTDVDAADIAALKAFINAAGQVSGGDVNSAFAFIESWFTASIGVDFEKRAVIFVTDTQTEDTMTAASSPGGNAYEMINRLSPFTAPADVDIYAINYNTSDTEYTSLIDNTESDGIPIISGSDTDGLTNAVLAGLSGRVTDMNPAHIIRECLTNPDWGMGYSEDDVDDVSFADAADTLFAERMGISLLWDKQTTLESFISDVIRHIDAALFVSRSTGKFVLKLTRDNYDPDTLITLDESNIDKIDSPSRAAFGELINSISVGFWDSETGRSDSLTVQDPAGVQMQGTVINTTINYGGFTNSLIAARVAARDLRALSNPFLTCTIYTGSVAEDLDIGDTFKLTWSKWSLSEVIMRVTGFAMSDGRSSQIRLTCVEDVFSTPLNAVVVPPPSGWEDPNGPPEPAAAQSAFEVPYYELVQGMGQTAADAEIAATPEVGFLGAGAMRGNVSAINARLWTDAGAGYVDVDTMELCPGGFLDAAITQTDTEIVLTDTEDLDLVVVGTHAQLGDGPEAELVRVDAVDHTTGEVTIGRGVLDTVPAIWPAGTMMLFWDSYNGFDPTEYVSGEVVDAKVTPVSGTGQLALSGAAEMTVEMGQRLYRPYPPGDLTINGDSYLDLIYSGDLTVEWVGRDRLQQTSGELADHFDGNIGPEAGTEYRVRDYVDGVLGQTVEPATSPLVLTPTGEGYLTIAADSKRDGVYSWQAASHTFIYVGTAVRRDEDDELRITEDGELRATED